MHDMRSTHMYDFFAIYLFLGYQELVPICTFFFCNIPLLRLSGISSTYVFAPFDVICCCLDMLHSTDLYLAVLVFA